MEHATIVAIATAPGRGAIGVIRVSGPRATAVLQRLAPGLSPTPRVATLSTLRVDGAVVDHPFGTTDVLVVLPVASIDPRYVDYYGAEGERYAA